MAENINDSAQNLIAELLLKSSELLLLKKAVFSKPVDKTCVKCVMTQKRIGNENMLQAESFFADNKARQENISLNDFDTVSSYIENYCQINLLTTAGDCEYRRSKSGNSVVIGGKKLEQALCADNCSGAAEYARILPGSNNKRKNYILSGEEPFLKLLGVSDINGRVYDKKQAKFRQINRFLELIGDIEDKLPENGTLRICDLCCGKSYLSFAVYHYFSVIKKRSVKMTGVDLKEDVIGYCSETADKLGFDGLEFIWGDIGLYETDEPVNLVLSLHACDTATDRVLEKAVSFRADVIMSTPCCHHELNRILKCPELSFISEYSMLRQKLCDAATDALRLKYLEANGYDTAAIELIDPDQTPKNILLRGVKRRTKDSPESQKAAGEYKTAYEFLTGKSLDN